MNIPAIRTALDAVLIPTTIRTLGSEKAVSLLEERSDGLHIGLKFAFPVAHIAADIANAVQEAVISHTGDTHIHLSIDTEIGTHKVQPGVATIKGVKNIIAVASGKGGVGKSTTTANLATAMARMGARVGVLDADLYGPSQPTMLGVQDRKPDQQNKKLIPVEAESGIQVMSIGFLVGYRPSRRLARPDGQPSLATTYVPKRMGQCRLSLHRPATRYRRYPIDPVGKNPRNRLRCRDHAARHRPD